MENKSKTKYHLFIDECGDQNLTTFDPTFPAFTLCGVLIPETKLSFLYAQVEKLKEDFCGSSNIILHSRDIRKCKGNFSFLQYEDKKQDFYKRVNEILSQNGVYIIVSCTILKEPFIQHFSKDADVYGLSLYYLLERSIFYADDHSDSPVIDAIVERRGKIEDRMLLNYYNRLRKRGTKWITKERFQLRMGTFRFSAKKENIIGLQLADLIAYPITRYVLNPQKPNPAFEVIRSNIYSDKGVMLGMKIKPN